MTTAAGMPRMIQWGFIYMLHCRKFWQKIVKPEIRLPSSQGSSAAVTNLMHDNLRAVVMCWPTWHRASLRESLISPYKNLQWIRVSVFKVMMIVPGSP